MTRDEALESLRLRFTSGNSVPVDRATISRTEYAALTAAGAGGEAVAWMRPDGHDAMVERDMTERWRHEYTVPLYTRPSDARVVDEGAVTARLYQHLLDMLGARDHIDAGRIIGKLHAGMGDSNDSA